MKPEDVPYFVVPGTVSPLWPSPWPYSQSKATIVVKRYKLADNQ